jgi:biotin transport system substrate-specific component
MKGIEEFMQEIKAKNKVQLNTKNLIISAMFTSIICVLSQVQIPIQTIPFSLGLLAIFLTGALLKPKYAFMAVLVYLLLGAVGVPVFANFRGGLQALTGPTGGYLMSYPFIALITSIFYAKIKINKTVALTLGMLISLLLCYALGTLWFTLITENSFIAALNMCVFPFILFDLAKIALSVSLSTVLRRTALKEML